tara:strand:+ start:653 stop:3115 length:2463 start_codon:yes stop_codon:yes gene_type:complete
MKKITYIKSFFFLIAFLSVVSFGFGQIVAWEMDGNAGNEVTVNATTLDGNLNMSTLSRGSGLNPRSLGDAFSSSSFTVGGTQASALTDNDYLQFQISTISGYQVSLSTLDATFRRSGNGPNSFIWRYSIDGVNFTDIGTIISYNISPTNGTDQTQINLATITALQNVAFGTTITFRLYGWGADINGTFAIRKLTGNDLSLGGTVTALPPCGTEIATWDGTNWIWDGGTPLNTVPTIATTSNVVINGNYDTSTGGFQASFSACSLTVSSTANLNIADNTFVEVQNNLTVDGIIAVQPQGAFIQNNDLGNVINNGTITVIKKTAPANAWYEYTYWSSPVSGETIGQGLFESEASRRYVFNGQNFLDATAESNNNNTQVPGLQDDIDDNGDDWENVGALTVMQPGVGYATMHSEAFFIGPPMSSPPYQFDYTFEGPFNNGVKDVPIYRNDSELNDNNWNFIGNPYPSAISADDFLSVNSNVGAIYFWSHNTPPSAVANGNEANNFSDLDYAIINGLTETAGGDSVTPNRFIPSGQGFFVSYDDTATPISTSGNISQGQVIFNNSMRMVDETSNSQFFKNSNTKKGNSVNKNNILWIDLTSSLGVFNQIAIGYADGATNGDDGLYYDAIKNVSINTSSTIYSLIDSSDKKYTIQGKETNSLNTEEIITLGFYTSKPETTNYTLSLAKIQGDFLTNNPIYLKDNVLNTTHDLTVSDYTFTSEVGEFNSRFQIVFSTNALSTENAVLDSKALRIVDLDNNRVQFNVSENLSIKTVTVFDLLGRQLYNLKGNSPSETYNLSNLNDAIYIAKVELSNGAIITKKAVKR